MKVTYNWNGFLGMYIPKFSKPEKVTIKRETDDRIYLYDHVVNTETGDAFLITGVKAPNVAKIPFKHLNEQIIL